MKGSLVTAFVAVAMCCIVDAQRSGTQLSRKSPSGMYTSEQAGRGSSLFAEHCAPCHAADLTGTPTGPGLTGLELASQWRNRPLGEFFSLMRSTMPKNSPGGLTTAQNVDLLAFILQQAKFTAGPNALDGNLDVLNTMTLAPDAR